MLNTGDIVKGTVIKITPTEVYVGLDAKADGIIPVGELTEDPSVSPEDIVKWSEPKLLDIHPSEYHLYFFVKKVHA